MKSYRQYCGLARGLDRIGQRWTLLIVRELLSGPKRFTDLRAGLPGIPTNLLAERLRQMQDDELIVQAKLPAPAAVAVYELTTAGAELRAPVEALIRWGGRWMQAGQGADDFQAGWLTLALAALGFGNGLKEEAIIRFECGGTTTHVAVGRGRARPARTDGRPTVIVRGQPQVILGMAAGALSTKSALARLRLTPSTRRSAKLLVDAVAKPPSKNF